MSRQFLKLTTRPCESAATKGGGAAEGSWWSAHSQGRLLQRCSVASSTTIPTCEPPVLDDLQQHVEHVGVRLLNLIKQHHAEGLAPA